MRATTAWPASCAETAPGESRRADDMGRASFPFDNSSERPRHPEQHDLVDQHYITPKTRCSQARLSSIGRPAGLAFKLNLNLPRGGHRIGSLDRPRQDPEIIA